MRVGAPRLCRDRSRTLALAALLAFPWGLGVLEGTTARRVTATAAVQGLEKRAVERWKGCCDRSLPRKSRPVTLRCAREMSDEAPALHAERASQ